MDHDPRHSAGEDRELVPFQLNSPMFYTYVLHSARDGEWYTGATSDLRARVRDHIQGLWNLVSYEACLSQADAFPRERHLKTGRGKRYLRLRLTEWRASLSPNKLERH